MKGVFWNSWGIGDLAKHNYISDLAKEHNLDFIAFMEIGQSTFPNNTLTHLCGGQDFLWHIMPPQGRSRGILMGVNLTVFDVGAIDEGNFYTKFLLKNKEDGFTWALYAIYGPAQQQYKTSFLAELASVCSKETHPMLIGGDFNILRKPEEKNNDNFDPKWPNLFNSVIELADLQEINLSGRLYTWANDLTPPTYEN